MAENSKRSTLIFLTSDFPFGRNEPFIENEIGFLSKSFDNIVICSLNDYSSECRQTPENSKIYRINAGLAWVDKILALRLIFTKRLWNELFQLPLGNKITLLKGRFGTALFSLRNALFRKSEILKILNKNKILINQNLVFYSYWFDDSAIALALLKIQFPAIRAVSRTHRWELYTEQTKFNYLPFRRFTLDQLDRVFSISEDGKNYLRGKYGAKNVFVSRLGTLKKYKRLKTQIDDQLFVLVSCSQIIERKRLDLIVDALASITTDKRIKWIHFGDGPLMSAVKEQVQLKENWNIDVIFKGSVSNQTVHEYYSKNQVDLFINVSDNEGVPVSIMEALSYKIPVIATNVGATAELVNESNGFLLSRDCTTEEIALKISDYMKLRGLSISQMQEKAFETWNNDFNADNNYNKFIHDIQS